MTCKQHVRVSERPLWLSLVHVGVTINASCTSMAFPSAWHSLVLSLPSIAVTCVLKAVISTLCSIATVSSPLLYFSQFSQAWGCLSVEVDSPVIWFSCLPHCSSATTFWLQWDISLSICALAPLIFLTVPHAYHFAQFIDLLSVYLKTLLQHTDYHVHRCSLIIVTCL